MLPLHVWEAESTVLPVPFLFKPAISMAVKRGVNLAKEGSAILPIKENYDLMGVPMSLP